MQNQIMKYVLEPINIGDHSLPGEAYAGHIRLATGSDPSYMDLSCGFTIPNGIYKIKELNINIVIRSRDDNRYEFFTLI